MKNTNLNRLPLLDLWYESSSDKKWKVNLPFNPKFPLWSGIKSEQSNVIAFELDPGCSLGEHKEDVEEILYVIGGKAEITVGGEIREVTEGELVVIPEGIVHAIKNIGEAPAKFLGFFPSTNHISTFTEVVSPIGLKAL
ncbi:cupin domain-containing protein [Paenibacillus thermotolerans]|uniref:cupin domain-containing protein n=1 Tax=Paenibacillus thermotolerans TaxID=3027807 RepID=UPI002368A316|nr:MULTISPECIES: cupin domain-containing protein [unclassified Paenibacillus]